MFPERFTAITFYQKKKDIVIYRAKDATHCYILKCIITEDEAVKQAFRDEYETLKLLSHPCLPIYYGLKEDFILPGQNQHALALCMEHRTGVSLADASSSLTLPELLAVTCSAGEVLSYLLTCGVLYTDLHPSNLLIQKEGGALRLTLLDFTYCYYFLTNPNPAYPLRFSYDLSPELKGQQLLIQELTLLLHALLEGREDSLPFSLCVLLETGFHPAETLSLEEFLSMLKECIR